MDQLRTLGEQIGVPVFAERGPSPVELARHGVTHAKHHALHVAIIDTAGRLQVDETLMAELRAIKAAVSPTEILMVADAMTGQEAVNIAAGFHKEVGLTGVILTKLDGDARGGAALSIRSALGVPLKFVGVGERPEQFEPFHPDRMAQRILGMGDVLTLIERAGETVDREQAAGARPQAAQEGGARPRGLPPAAPAGAQDGEPLLDPQDAPRGREAQDRRGRPRRASSSCGWTRSSPR